MRVSLGPQTILVSSILSSFMYTNIYTAAALNFNADFVGKFWKILTQSFLYFFTAG